MSVTLRLFCILGAAAVFVMISRRIHRASMRIEDAIFWIVLSFLLLVVAIFPELAYFCAGILGFQAPSNFVFLATITILLVKAFNDTLAISQLRSKVDELVQEEALHAAGDQHADRGHADEDDGEGAA